jgi:hypothetical protein
VVGDWSPVHLRRWTQRILHWTEHPLLTIDSNEATRRNQALNLRLLECVAPRLATLRRSVALPRFYEPSLTDPV